MNNWLRPSHEGFDNDVGHSQIVLISQGIYNHLGIK